MKTPSLRCWLFGHQPPVYAPKGWWSPGESYAKVVLGAADGQNGDGRRHAAVYSECPRCGEEFLLCYIHVPKVEKERQP